MLFNLILIIDKEMERKKHLQSLYNRSKEQIEVKKKKIKI